MEKQHPGQKGQQASSGNIRQFAQDWRNNENLQKKFAQNPEQVCKQYGIEGENKKQILEMAKEGKNLKERISTFFAGLTGGAPKP